MKRKTLLFVVPLMAVLASCSPNNESTEGSITVTDMLSRKVQVNPGSYERIVCIGAGALRIFSYVGDISKLAGVEDIDNTSLSSRPKVFDGVARPYLIANEDALKKLPSCGVGGPQNQKIESEKIISCNPDLIISLYQDSAQADKLQEDSGAPVIALSYGNKGVFDERVTSSLKLLGQVLDKEERAETLVSYISQNKTSISELAKDDVDKKAYICGLGNWGTTNHLTTAQNYEPFNVANIENVVTGFGENTFQVSIDEEKFISLSSSMDVMFFDAAAVKNIKSLSSEDPSSYRSLFEGCKAFQDGEVYLQMAYNAYYTNLEIALANTWWNAKCVHASAFSDIDMKDKLNEITKTFNGQELAEKIYEYPYSYTGYRKLTINDLIAQ